MSKILEFYNNTTPEEKCQLLNMMARDITIPTENKDLKNYLQDIIEENVNLLNPNYKDNWKNFKSNKPHN